MSKTMITVSLSKKDAVLNTWWNHEKNYSRRELALMALEHYFKTGNYLNIGRVVPQPLDTSKVNRILLYTTQSDIVTNWIEKEREISTRKMISEVRRILYRSIEQVTSERQEHIPSPYDDLEEIEGESKIEEKIVVKNTPKIVNRPEEREKPKNNSFAASLVNSIMADNPAKLGK